MRHQVPTEVYELINAKELVPVGATYKVRHLYDDDGNACSLNKTRALAITRKDGGWTWFCHRCGCKGGIKELHMSADQVLKHLQQKQEKLPVQDGCSLPDDTKRITQNDMSSQTRSVPWDALTWLLKYQMGGFLQRYYFGWSAQFHRVIMPVMTSPWTTDVFTGPELIGWVGRDPVERSKEDRKKLNMPKYLIRKGRAERPIFTAKPNCPVSEFKPFVIVEDILSAIRVSDAMNCVAFAILNTDVPRQLLDRIGDKTVILWLDNDMTTKMISQTAMFRNLGYKMKYISTQKDPKCYNEMGIRQVVNYMEKSEGIGVHPK